MFIYYKDKFNNLHTIIRNYLEEPSTSLHIVCTRENKPLDNMSIIIQNEYVTYTGITDIYGELQMEVEPGLYNIIIDGYVIEQEVEANTTTSINFTMQYSVYGILYNENIVDPEKCLTYCNDSLRVKDWNIENLFLNIKPCLFKDGKRQLYLNPNDFTKTENGETINLSDINNGDIMIEIPKIGIKFDEYQGQKRIQVTTNPDLLTEGFHYYAHTRDIEGDRDYLYIGAFLGTARGTNLRSLGDSHLFINNNINILREYAQSNGQGYDLLSFYPFVLLQTLFLLKYKTLDSQKILGMGYTSLTNTNYILTGNTFNKGMDHVSTNGNEQMKFLGIEDLWGNNYCYIDGIYYDNNYNITTAFKDFNNTGINYINRENAIQNKIEGYLSKSTFSAECGFLPLVTTNTPHIYNDKIQRANNTGIVVGGTYNSSYDAGLFSSFNRTYLTNISTRLMYL